MHNEALGFAAALAIGLAVAVAVFWVMLSGTEVSELIVTNQSAVSH